MAKKFKYHTGDKFWHWTLVSCKCIKPGGFFENTGHSKECSYYGLFEDER